MSSVKKCAKCEKTVYPTEELKCLDKVWHKACFKCQVCNMTLSMRNYKGFDKLPYCGAHVPKAKATIVADTPEMKRLAENSKNISNIQYHAEFEASRGKFTQIADDPEIQRIKANSATISNISYHDVVGQKAEQEKKRSLVEGQQGAMPTQPQASRVEQNGSNGRSNDTINKMPPPQSHTDANQQRQLMQQQQQYNTSKNSSMKQTSSSSYSNEGRKMSNDYIGGGHHSGRVSQSSISSTGSASSYSQQHSIQARSQPLPPSSMGGGYPASSQYGQVPPTQQQNQMGYQQMSYPRQAMPNQSLPQQPPQYRQVPPQQYPSQSQMTRQLSGSGYYPQQQQQQPTYQYQQPPMGNYRQPPMQQQMYQQQMQMPQQPQKNLRGRCYQAMYDYEAQDTDEVSFKDGDLIVNCTHIDEGWMTGTVHRTGKFGMLPANYVEPVVL